MRVAENVRRLVDLCAGKVHKKRVAAVVRACEGVIRASRLTPATIGRHLPGRQRPKHGIKAADRLLASAGLAASREDLYRALATRLIGGSERPVILIDWTQLTPKLVALVAAVAADGRALPIWAEVHPLRKLSNTTVEARFVATLRRLLPDGCRPIIVSDAGFKGPLFEAVVDLGWDFVGRIRGTSKAVTASGSTVTKQELYALASPTPRDCGSFRLFIRHQIPCRLVVIRRRRRPGPKKPPPRNREERELRQAALDPWLLATSLAHVDAAQVVALYAKRMQIEETFRDAKNHRFGWSLGTIRTASASRAANLLLIAALAYAAVTLIGMTVEQRGLHRAYQANTVKRRVLSLFVLGLAVISRRDETSAPATAVFACAAALHTRIDAKYAGIP
jgi:hypothetical protein